MQLYTCMNTKGKNEECRNACTNGISSFAESIYVTTGTVLNMAI